MNTITQLKRLADSIGCPDDSGKVYPYVIIFVMPNPEVKTESGWVAAEDGFINEGGKLVSAKQYKEWRAGVGYIVCQLAVFKKLPNNLDEYENYKLFEISKVRTQRGGERVYKSLDTLKNEFKTIFGSNSGLQIRGL